MDTNKGNMIAKEGNNKLPTELTEEEVRMAVAKALKAQPTSRERLTI